MPTPLTISEDDAETLLNGVEPVPDEFADLGRALANLKAEGEPQPGDDFSALIAAAAMESRLSPIEQFATLQITITDDWTARVVRRAGVGVAALFLLVAGTTGMAYAANGAGPGDLLYGLDRAIEAVGIGNGGAAERLAEAQGLVTSGEVPAGLTHAAEVVAGTPAGDTGTPAIEAAAERVENLPVGPDSQVSDAVQALFGYIHDQSEASAQIDGQTVAILAHNIGGRPDSPASSENAGRPEDTPREDPGKPEDTPGGPRDDPGKPADTPREDPGKPGDTPGGPPETPANQKTSPTDHR